MALVQQYVLFELAAGYALFLRKEAPDLEQLLTETQISLQDFARFRKLVKLVSFSPFTTADMAVENIDAIVNGTISPFLREFLELQFSGVDKETVEVGVSDATLGKNIQDQLELKCVISDTVHELSRWIRFHLARFLPDQKEADIQQAQLGLAHGYSRISVKMNVHRSDNMIIQAISLLDQMDKDINTFAMRVKEWYGWHFPELRKIVTDNTQFCKLVVLIKSKTSLAQEDLSAQLLEIVGDEAVVQEIVTTAPISMGMEFVEQDFANIETFARRVINLAGYRKQLHEYLCTKMSTVAPNLAAILGEQIGGRLICQAGSLTNLAKFPASTVQILGAEKALFRALKNRGNTPKYGLIFHSPFISRAGTSNKGKISRYLANKASLCSRIDCFMDTPNGVIGAVLKKQVEDRLKFLEEGTPMPMSSNQEYMDHALVEMGKQLKAARKATKARKTSAGEGATEEAPAADAGGDDEEAKKKRKEEKKKRKEKAQAEALAAVLEGAEPEAAEDAAPKKKKKKKNAAEE
eukprot:RCo004594